jgi:2-phosphosulfolactate phosphatase
MEPALEVLFAPAEFEALRSRDLTETVCVVFDVLRATSTMLTALASGAQSIVPVAEISEALTLRARDPGVLLAGERHGVRILADQTGSIDFDFGNSPREFTADRVRGKKIAITTTNGTRALRACASAKQVLIGTFLGLGALATRIAAENPPHLLLICAGTYDRSSYEDTLAAGALADAVWHQYGRGRVADSTHLARLAYQQARPDLLAAMTYAQNGRRLLSIPELRDDVPYCLRRDTIGFVAGMIADGTVQRWE